MIRLFLLPLLLLSFNAFAAGDVKFNWQQTTQRTDDTPLLKEEIGGNKIYIKNATGGYDEYHDVTNGFFTTVTLSFPDGVYTAVMTTYDQQNRESDYSLEVGFTVGTGIPPPVVIFPPKATTGVTVTPLL